MYIIDYRRNACQIHVEITKCSCNVNKKYTYLTVNTAFSKTGGRLWGPESCRSRAEPIQANLQRNLTLLWGENKQRIKLIAAWLLHSECVCPECSVYWTEWWSDNRRAELQRVTCVSLNRSSKAMVAYFCHHLIVSFLFGLVRSLCWLITYSFVRK